MCARANFTATERESRKPNGLNALDFSGLICDAKISCHVRVLAIAITLFHSDSDGGTAAAAAAPTATDDDDDDDGDDGDGDGCDGAVFACVHLQCLHTCEHFNENENISVSTQGV